jgi:PAS domain S-box-containing protein
MDILCKTLYFFRVEIPIQELAGIIAVIRSARIPIYQVNLMNSNLKTDQATEIRAELERYKGLLQTLSNAVDAKVSYVDAQYRYRFVNEQYEHWYETTADQLIGKTPQELMGEEYQYVKRYVEAALSGEEVQYETALSFTDGQQRLLSLTHTPHFDESGNVLGIFVVCVDITEQKRLQEQLEELKTVKA